MKLVADKPTESAESLVNAVLSASRALVAVAARSLAGVAEEVTLTQYRTLVVLASRGPQSLAGLAEALAVTPATATRMCDRLVAKGLVKRRTERGDRRQIRVALSAKGRLLIDEVTARRRDEISHIIRAIPGSERPVIIRALARLAEAAGEVPEQEWSTGWDI